MSEREARIARPNSALQVLAEMEQRLAAITTVAEAKEVRDQADALRRYAQHSKKGLAAQNACARVKLLAEHRAGELLLAVERERGKGGGRGKRKTSFGSQTKFGRALREVGVSSATAHNWQLLAQNPVERLEAFLRQQMEAGEEIVSRDVYAELHGEERRQRERERVVTDEDRRWTTMAWIKGRINLDHQMYERLRRVMEIEGVRSFEEAFRLALDAWERSTWGLLRYVVGESPTQRVRRRPPPRRRSRGRSMTLLDGL